MRMLTSNENKVVRILEKHKCAMDVGNIKKELDIAHNTILRLLIHLLKLGIVGHRDNGTSKRKHIIWYLLKGG